MLTLLIYLLIVLIVLGAAWYIVTLIPLPHPLGQVAQVVIVVIGLICIIWLLLSLVGSAPPLLR